MGLFLNGILYPFSMMLRTKEEACKSFFQNSVASWIFPTTVFDVFGVAKKKMVGFFFFLFFGRNLCEKFVSGVQEKLLLRKNTSFFLKKKIC